MSEVTLTDNYGDDLRIDTDFGIEIFLDDARDWFVKEAADALPIADAIYEAAGRNRRVHDGAVRAGDVSFNEAVLRLAIAHSRTVEFSYAKGSGNSIERRRLQPDDVREVKGHLTFTGFDPDRQEPRAYRLDRIAGEVGFY